MGRQNKPFNNPFAQMGNALKAQLKEAKKAEKKAKKAALFGTPKPQPAPSKRSAAPVLDTPEGSDQDAALFAKAVQDTTPLGDDPRGLIKPPEPPPDAQDIPFFDEDAEVYAELLRLVEGHTRFDIQDSDEFIEGCIEGLDRRVLQRLKRGEYSFSAHLDLHGLGRDDAKSAVERFMMAQRLEKNRCVLIVHGRGLNSKDKIPVLKRLLKGWLERGKIARSVLAFCTAQPHDGGAGAMYVLLRR